MDEHNLAEITSEEYPDEGLIVGRNRRVATERTHKREDSLAATERALAEIAQPVANATPSAARRSASPSATSVLSR